MSTQDLFTNVHSSFSDNGPKLETDQAVQQENDLKIVAHLHGGILLRNTKERALDIYNGVDESQKHHAGLKKSDTKVLHRYVTREEAG